MKALPKNKVHVLIALLFLCATLRAQHITQQVPSLTESIQFFEQQGREMERWLRSNVSPNIALKGIKTDSNSVTLQLEPKEQCVCSAKHLLIAHLEATHPDFGNKLLKKWAFLAEIDIKESRVEIRCCDQAHVCRKYAYSEIPVDGGVSKSGVTATPYIVPLAMGQDQIVAKATDDTELTTLIPETSAPQVAKNIRQFCQQKYTSLPKARYIWDAELRLTELSETEFQLEVTYITNVVSSDSYFEYHKIYVATQQSGTNTVLNARLVAKYGSGIIFAPRRNDYKDMELTYKNELSEFRNVLYKQLIYAASKR